MIIETQQEKDLILKGLCRDRDELAAKLGEVERLIKKIKTNTITIYSTPVIEDTQVLSIDAPKQGAVFPFKAEFKFQVLAVMDMIGLACKLKEIQTKYTELTGSTYSVRETLRTLNKHKVIKMLRAKDGDRGLYWVKTDWLEDNNTILKEKYKFYGFDVLYKDNSVEYV